jgi:tetratricopeptide (TPR) repeat protein
VGQAARPAPSTPAAAPARVRSIDQLARVEAPRYAPSRLRGVADEATSRFQRGMAHYARADYARAIPDLDAAARLAPDAPHITFYLGIAHLMTGQGDAAIDRLQATVALGESAYLADAHWYLAKAYLRRQDVRAAESHLRQCIRLGASNPEEASRLLEDVERVQRSPR